MAQVQIIRSAESAVAQPRVSAQVRIKEAWGDDWTVCRYLLPVSAMATCLPDIGRAEFTYEYGNIVQHDATAAADFRPQSLADWYISIWLITETTERLIWIGVVVDETFTIAGSEDATPSGSQHITAYGLEHLLTRYTITGAYYLSGGLAVRIERDLVWNERYAIGRTDGGNRSASVGPDGHYLFDASATSVPWTNYDIAAYLLHYYVDAVDAANPQFELGGQAAALLDPIVCKQQLSGLRVFQALTHLCERQRGICAVVRYDAEGERCILDISSVYGEDVSVGDVTIPANPVQYSFSFDTALDVNPVVHLSAQRQVDKIIVRGKPIISCFTLSYADGTLEAGWTAAEETTYLAGAALGVTPDDHDSARKMPENEAVYQLHRIPSGWTWQVQNGLGAGPLYNVVPTCRPDGTLDTATLPNVIGLRRGFLRSLPILKTRGATDAEPEYLAPLAIMGMTFYYNVADVDPELGILSAARVRMVDREMAVTVEPPINHLYASADFVPGTPGTEDTNYLPQADYRNLMVTVAMETDEVLRVEAELPAERQSGQHRSVVIDVDDAELWYVVPDTVSGAQRAVLTRRTGGTARDDSDRLRGIAALALAWYGQPRTEITVGIESLGEYAALGSYLVQTSSSWHTTQVGTVVTSKAWDFRNHTTTLRTAYSELDFRRMVEVPGMSDLAALGRTVRRMASQVRDIQTHVGGLPARWQQPPPAFHPSWINVTISAQTGPNLALTTIPLNTLHEQTWADEFDLVNYQFEPRRTGVYLLCLSFEFESNGLAPAFEIQAAHTITHYYPILLGEHQSGCMVEMCSIAAGAAAYCRAINATIYQARLSIMRVG